MKCTMTAIFIVLATIKMVCKCEKEVNVYTQPHSAVLRHNSSQQSMSSIQLFTPGIMFPYNATCQLHYCILSYQEGAKIRKRCK